MHRSEGRLVEILKRHQQFFHPVVNFDPDEKILAFDFSQTDGEVAQITKGDIIQFTDYISSVIKSNGARFGIGGYNELRAVYGRSSLFDNDIGAVAGSAEPRRLHLGIDIWAEAGTEVFAPLEGTVHSFAFNDHPGDYGATIILKHRLEGAEFHTLYGHLSLHSIASLREGDSFSPGQLLAHFGNPAENGNWPPHLHFQIIEDIGSHNGNYPGVCKHSEGSHYLENCPDPDLILGMNNLLS